MARHGAQARQGGPGVTNFGLSGKGGEIRVGRKVAAVIEHWSKEGARNTPTGRVATIEFALVSINEFWANYGPPTTVAVALPAKPPMRSRRLVYDVESGDFRAGALTVKLPPRVETT